MQLHGAVVAAVKTRKSLANIMGCTCPLIESSAAARGCGHCRQDTQFAGRFHGMQLSINLGLRLDFEGKVHSLRRLLQNFAASRGCRGCGHCRQATRIAGRFHGMHCPINRKLCSCTGLWSLPSRHAIRWPIKWDALVHSIWACSLIWEARFTA